MHIRALKVPRQVAACARMGVATSLHAWSLEESSSHILSSSRKATSEKLLRNAIHNGLFSIFKHVITSGGHNESSEL